MRLAAAMLGALALTASPAGAVVNGKPVPQGQLGAVANIKIAGNLGCTGTLIAPTWVMTAGHCGSVTGALGVPTSVTFPASAYEVILGTVNSDGSGGESHAVKQLILAEDYGIQNGSGSDISLLELDAASQQAPIRIAAVAERKRWNPGVLATIAGFGVTEEDGDAPAQMQQAQVPIQADDVCAADYPDGSFNAATMLCAGFPEGGTDTCQGDSGGPLLVALKSGTQRLAGATSFGDGCAKPGKPGIYARVAEGSLRAFVKKIVPAALAPEPTPKPKPAAKPKPKPKPKPHRKPHKKPKHKKHKTTA